MRKKDTPVYLMDSPPVNDPDYDKQVSIYEEMSVVNAWENYNKRTDDIKSGCARYRGRS